MDDARAALDAAGERQAKIDSLIAEEQKKLDSIKEARMSRGSGRPSKGEANKYAAIERKIARLRRGVLPDEPESDAAQRTAAELRASAQQHAQHHATAANAASSRSSVNTAAAACSCSLCDGWRPQLPDLWGCGRC